MKQTKHKFNKDDIVIIASEQYTGEERPSYLCSFCNQTLSRLTDAGMNNTTFWCRSCSVEFDPESENIRRESKLVVPERNVEPAVTSVGFTPDVSIEKNIPMRGGFAELQKKGLRFTSYHTTEKE
jgi:hypothetical protein